MGSSRAKPDTGLPQSNGSSALGLSMRDAIRTGVATLRPECRSSPAIRASRVAGFARNDAPETRPGGVAPPRPTYGSPAAVRAGADFASARRSLQPHAAFFMRPRLIRLSAI